jgi:hypothetical protein
MIYRGVGTGADELTKLYGAGLSTARQSAGLHRLSFKENPGTLVGSSFGFQAATPANVGSHTVVLDTWTAKSGSTDAYIDFLITNASGAAHDLLALEWVNLQLWFTKTGVSG